MNLHLLPNLMPAHCRNINVANTACSKGLGKVAVSASILCDRFGKYIDLLKLMCTKWASLLLRAHKQERGVIKHEQ